MFKQRLLTTLILVPLVLLAIYYASLGLLGAIVVVLITALSLEWLQLIPVTVLWKKGLFVGMVFGLVLLAHFVLQAELYVVFVLWALILVAVIKFPASQRFWGRQSFVAGVGLLLLPVFANALAALYQRPHGKDLLVYLLCLVWATDIGAYLAGKQWGRHKLIPNVSPGKTYEGAIGGLVLAMGVACIGAIYFNPHYNSIWFALSLGAILLSMLGDLLISMLKRRCNLKDTGHIFPGHGGVLDRLDSMIAALPFFYGMLYLSSRLI